MNEALYYLLVASGFVLVYLGYYGLRFRKVRGAVPFALLMFAMALHTLGYAFEINAATQDQMYFWVKLQYLGIVFYPPLIFRMLLRSLDHKGLYRLSQWGAGILLATVSAISLLGVWGYPVATAYYRQVTLLSSDGFRYLSYAYGPLYYLQGIVLAGVIICGLLLVAGKALKSSGANRRRMLWLALGFLMPVIALPFHVLFRDQLGADFWPLVFMPMGIMVFAALRRCDVQFLSHLTHEMLLAATEDMIVVADDLEIVLLTNAAAQRPGSPVCSLHVGDSLKDAPLLCSLEMGFSGLVNWQERHYVVRVLTVPQGFGTMYIIRDESESFLARQQLLALSRTDSLTQLFNRRYLEEYLVEHPEGIIALLDIDYFKQINDTLGHLTGDYVLLALSEALRRHFPDALKVRYGGEEFALIFETLEEDALVDVLCPRLFALMTGLNADLPGLLAGRHAIDDKALDQLKQVELTLSIGMSVYAHPFTDGFMQADRALYRSKAAGRNCIHIAKGGELCYIAPLAGRENKTEATHNIS